MRTIVLVMLMTTCLIITVSAKNQNITCTLEFAVNKVGKQVIIKMCAKKRTEIKKQSSGTSLKPVSTLYLKTKKDR